MTPLSVSPVLKTRITVTLESTFPFTIKKEDFEISATNIANSTIVKYLKVVQVDDAAKTFVMLFGGA